MSAGVSLTVTHNSHEYMALPVPVLRKLLPSIPEHLLFSAETVPCDSTKATVPVLSAEHEFPPAAALYYTQSGHFSASHMPHHQGNTKSHLLPARAILWHGLTELEINADALKTKETGKMKGTG